VAAFQKISPQTFCDKEQVPQKQQIWKQLKERNKKASSEDN
jgi:hypothetical protein